VPTRTVNLDGLWGFTPVTNTLCTAGARATVGPFVSCVDSPASGEPTTIAVPGGGWHKQGYTDLSEAVYSRKITVPDIPGAGQVTKISFGAINHKATLSVDGHVVGSQVTAYTSSVFDISDFVHPGSTHEIEVRVQGRKALVGPDGRYTVPEGASWSDDVAQGIFRSADLEVFPSVAISDTVVRTSVARRQLSYDVYVSNATDHAQDVVLDGSLGSWNNESWKYPTIAKQTVRLSADSTTKVTVGPMPWTAGAGSYWEPNIPYRAGYRAQLHDLTVRVRPDLSTSSRRDERGQPEAVLPSTAHVRFGFREIKQVGDHYELNGTRVNFRGDSLQGANYDNVDYHGRGDAYDTFPGFLKPSQDNGGWPRVVENYLRLNFSGVRMHQVPATPYMLDIADESGLMILDETAIRGSNNRENFITGRANMVKHLADLVRRDRNHASVLRWSQSNEPTVGYTSNPGAGAEFNEALYQTVMALDTTRPISTDSAGDFQDDNLPHDNYTAFCHYADGVYPPPYTESICSSPPGKPQGQTEFVWPADNTPQGAVWLATGSLRMRAKGAADVRPYTLLDLWSSVVPGVKRTDITVEWGYPSAGLHPLYGEDNLSDPWANPHIQLVQKAFNPTAAVDTDFWNANKLSNAAGQWPTTPATVAPGKVTRELTLFNDTLKGEQVDLTWRLRVGAPDGAVVDQGKTSRTIALGTHQQLPVTVDVPDTTQQVYLDLEVSKPGEGTLYRDAGTVYRVQQRS